MKEYKNEYRKFLVERFSFFRTKAHLSARDLSQRLGMSDGYVGKYEMGTLNMPSEMLLDAIKVMGVSTDEFFSKNPATYDEERKVIEKWNKLSEDNKKLVLEIMDKLK